MDESTIARQPLTTENLQTISLKFAANFIAYNALFCLMTGIRMSLESVRHE